MGFRLTVKGQTDEILLEKLTLNHITHEHTQPQSVIAKS